LREPFQWFKSGKGVGQSAWQPSGKVGFLPKFDRPNDGISLEEQQQAANSIFQLVRALTNLRKEVPVFANGSLGRILTDSSEWMAFERFAGGSVYLVLLNPTATGRDYKFGPQWYKEYVNAQLLFWSDGQGGSWKDLTKQNDKIQDSVFVPQYGFVLLRQQ
jgi:glycosidase